MKALLLAFSLFCFVFTAGQAQQTNPTATATNEVDLAELSKNSAEWPAEVTLTQKILWPVIFGGKEHGFTGLPAGTKLKLIQVLGRQLKVFKGETVTLIPVDSTDLVKCVIAARREKERLLRLEANQETTMAEKARQPAPQRAVLAAEAQKQVAKGDVAIDCIKFNLSSNIRETKNGWYAADLFDAESGQNVYVEFPKEGLTFMRVPANDRVRGEYFVYGTRFQTEAQDGYGIAHIQICWKLIGSKKTRQMGGKVSYSW